MINDLSEEGAAVKHLGGVDVLVDNAGNAGGVGRPGMKPNCVRAAPPHMIAKSYDRIGSNRSRCAAAVSRRAAATSRAGADLPARHARRRVGQDHRSVVPQAWTPTPWSAA